MASESTTRKSPTQDIFDRIKTELDNGTVPWHKPWVVRPECIMSRRGRPYSLRNRMLLSYAGEYATFHQVKAEGGTVNKGAKGQWVYFAKSYTKSVKNDEGEDEEEVKHVLRAYCVFNILDTSLEPKYRDKWGGEPPTDCDALEVVKDYTSRTGIILRFTADRAFYSPSDDIVQVPCESDFDSREAFYSTLFHELGHSTAKTLKRDFGHVKGSPKYAREELVAEICAALCLGRLGMDTQSTVVNSAAYVDHWRKHITDIKPTEFGDACYQAQRAFNLIFNITTKESNDE